jgi:hypothetical protein
LSDQAFRKLPLFLTNNQALLGKAGTRRSGPPGLSGLTLSVVDIDQLRLQQRDGVTCGPSVAIVAAALLDSGYAGQLHRASWFAEEQGRLHRQLNKSWPRAMGTTPAGMVAALSRHSTLPYRWRLPRGRRDGLFDIREALLLGFPVAMLVGRFIPRHWVLLTEVQDNEFTCYEPSSGSVLQLSAELIRQGRLAGVGFPQPFCYVLPARRW